MKLGNLSRGEWIAMAGGLLLGISVFVKAYEAQPQNPNATLETGKGGVCGDHTCSYFQVHTISALAAAGRRGGPVHPRLDHHPRARAVVAARAGDRRSSRSPRSALIFYNGIIDRPGEPSGAIELEFGWYVALLGALLMLVGSVLRQQETEVKRKPPGTL